MSTHPISSPQNPDEAILASVENAPFAFWIKIPEGPYIYGNRSCEDLAGQPIEGKTTADLWGADGARETLRYERLAMQTGIDQRIQIINGTVVLVVRYPMEYDGRAALSGVASRIAPLPCA